MKCSENRNVQHVQNSYDGDRVANMVLRHATGLLTQKVFFSQAISNAMLASSSNAINAVVKAREKERRDKVCASAASDLWISLVQVIAQCLAVRVWIAKDA